MSCGLAVIETHPVQYHAPVYRALQQRHGIDVTVIYGSDFSVAGYRDTEFQTEFAWDTDLLSGYQSRFLSTVRNGGGRTSDAVSSHGVRHALRSIDPRAILLLGYSPSFYQWTWLQALREGRPLLFRGETSEAPQSNQAFRQRLRSGILRMLYRSCRKVLYIGENSRRHFAGYGCPPDKLVFSPYCVDISPFHVDEQSRNQSRQQMRSALGIGGDDTVLLFAGKLSHRKGPDLLVEAVKQLPAERRARTTILFLGSGELEQLLREAAAGIPAVKAHFAGFQNQKQLSPYYHASDLLVLPSRHSETWGLVVNEALHHGIPCLVSDAVGCWPDLIRPGETGEVFGAGSAAELSAGILRAVDLVDRSEIRRQCRERVSGYTIEHAADGIAAAYRAAVGD
jgi:glycosyltransferase involved in cell wall biosynthesis